MPPILAVVVLSSLSLISIVIISILRPDDTQAVVSITQFIVPTIAVLITLVKAQEAASKAEEAVIQTKLTHDLVNSTASELIKLTATAAHAEGKLEGLTGEKPMGETTPTGPNGNEE